MQRQKSILSFLQKQSPENPSSGTFSSYTGMLQRSKPSHGLVEESDSLSVRSFPSEAFATETPPEKPPRRVLPLGCLAHNDLGVQPFSSIMKAFSIDDEQDSIHERNPSGNNSGYLKSLSVDDGQGLKKERTHLRHPLQDDISPPDGGYGASVLNLESIPRVLEPETAAMRPVVPRVKRTQEDGHNTKDDCYLIDSNKRVKLLKNSGGSMIPGDACGAMGSKFEWLDPSMIRDANGRRPGDALYDQRTLYIPPDALKKMSASQRQYWSVKCQYMDVVLFFKVGKFYELYELDAEIGHKELDWKITNSGVGKCRQVGISEGGIDDAVQKLVARGYKVGRMEQTETAGQAKARGTNAVIERKLVHVFTPSTATDENIGSDAIHLLFLKEGSYDLENRSRLYGFAFLDYAALKIWVGSVCDDASCSALGALLVQISPKEVVYESKGFSAEARKVLKKYASAGSAMQLSPMTSGTMLMDASEVVKLAQSKGYFKKSSHPQASGLDVIMPDDFAICALGDLIDHLSRIMLHDALFNGEILSYQVYSSCLRMDGQTLLNLEIFSNNADGGSLGTLYKYLDNCITSFGKRLLRKWICHPLKNIGEINDRLDALDSLLTHSEITFITEQYLHKIPDLERLLGRVKASIGNSARLVLPSIGEKLLKQQVKAFGSLIKGLRTGLDLLVILQKEETGLSSLLKVLNLPLLSCSNGISDLLSQIEAAVDDSFPKYQDHDVKDSDAETLSVIVELFTGKCSIWSQIIHALSCVDVLQSFAVTAGSSCGCMCRPVIMPANSTSIFSSQETKSPMLKIKGLWHPYAIGGKGGEPVPNDICLGEDTAGYCPRSLLLTGPNMGGKSTLLRAICLAVIMAQLGCYVPCEMCVLSPVDIIFTRLGATDRIMMGESTFFIECSETASVLQNATQDSLVLLDELGRGTSTFDGYAIAYAVFRHLVEKVHCRLLFATHYHPLTKEFASHPRVSLQHMACAFNPRDGSSFTADQELVFLYKLTLGPCPESYGLQVALMAGIPKHTVQCASKASRALRRSIGENFRSSEARSEFSTIHEEWLKTLLTVSMTNDSDLSEDDSDTLLLLWHELKGCNDLLKGKQ